MRKYSILIAVMVLTTVLFTGCRRKTPTPTELPPTQGTTLMPTTIPTTIPTTAPTTEAPTIVTDPTIETGTVNPTDGTTTGARSGMNK